MLLFPKKKTGSADKAAKEPEPLESFVPYHSHFNAHTLITKNGELLQIIKIDSNVRGLNYESGDGSGNSVRDNIRRAVADAIPNAHYSLWIHTLRKRKPVGFSATFDEPFSAHVNASWQKKHRWKYEYYNEIYVSILHEGQDAQLFDQKTLKHTLLKKTNRHYRNAYLDNAASALDTVVAAIGKKIGRHYATRRLALSERPSAQLPGKKVFYSEPMEFLGTLINLRPSDFPVPEADVSTALTNHAVTFGFNAVETRSAGGQRRFGALMTLKQYREITTETVDRVLQAPIELIISQAFHFTPPVIALKQYREQKELFEASGDGYSARASGLEDMLRNDHEKPTDYGIHQISIMVLADEYKLLDDEMADAQNAFAELGLITVREDIRLEECFWAQLPGNFEFVRRPDPIASSKIAGFARLNLFPNGLNQGNHWGEALTLVPTGVNSPYFFNFHDGDNGHTLLFDFNSFHDHNGHALLNFLLTCTLKYHGRLFIFDRKNIAHLMMDKLGGHYHRFLPTAGQAAQATGLNPFTLEPTPRNQSFLLAWCLALAEPRLAATDAHKDAIKDAIGQTYAASPAERNFPYFIARLAALDASLAEAFAEFHGRGKLASIFGAGEETFDLSRKLHAFDMEEAVRQQVAVPLFSYLLHRIITQLDGTPTVIVLHEALDLLENSFFAPRLESLLEMLRQHNVMVVCTGQNPQQRPDAQSLATLLQSCATRLYVPDDVALEYASLAPGLDGHDETLLGKMERQKGDVLLKQKDESIALRISFDDMEDIRAIFSGDIKNLIAAGGPFASLPKDK